jgi:transaldolase
MECDAMSENIRRIAALGQSLWLDYISRDLLRSGALQGLIEEGITGMTSNPTIFHKSIAGGSEYDDEIAELAARGLSAGEIYEQLAMADIGEAADQLRGVYNETHARDGYVSIEVNPHLARDTDGTIAEARRLFHAIGRPNVMIKVPATEAGLPAITALIGAGINVNVTLIFSIAMYEKVMEAYIRGLRQLQSTGRPLGLVASVASFFVSRVDTLVDEQLAALDAGRGDPQLAELRGTAAVANARLAYARYREVFGSPGFASLRALGARPQRPLWASTGTKNPAYSPTKYVDELIGPETVNTVPLQTLEAIRRQATPACTVDRDPGAAGQVMEQLAAVGIDMNAVTARLLTDGVRLFVDSFDRLLADLEAKRSRLMPAAAARSS